MSAQKTTRESGGAPSNANNATVRPTAARGPLAAYLKTAAWAAGTEAGSVGAGVAAVDSDIVLAARARLARNLLEYPFPSRAADRDLRRVAQEIRRAALADTERLAYLTAVSLSTLSVRDRTALVEARRISPELAEGRAYRWALLDDAGIVSLLINEEDHLRIQAIIPGNMLTEVLAEAEDIAARLARRLKFAYQEQWGFLTTALTNVGTGMRLSALIHLPALAFQERLTETLQAAQLLGISIRGAHGEHSQAAGDLYQISNAVTFGAAPEHIAGRIRPVVDYLVAAERAARKELVAADASAVIEAARTAWTRIERADRLSAEEALNLLSRLRLAAALDLTPLGGHAPAPNAALFAALVADLRTGAGLTLPLSSSSSAASSVQDAIQRPAKIRAALRRFYRKQP